MSNQTHHETTIACNIGAIESAERDQHMDIATGIFTTVLETKALDDGICLSPAVRNTDVISSHGMGV